VETLLLKRRKKQFFKGARDMAEITKEMTIKQVIDMDINCAPVFFGFGMHCIGCPSASAESLEQASAVHGVNADELVEKLNDYFSK
jgi:hybrid cluster-associated redox disulfide protein